MREQILVETLEAIAEGKNHINELNQPQIEYALKVIIGLAQEALDDYNKKELL